jgi:hypothetical protein
VSRQCSSVSRVAKMLNHADPKPSPADVVISHVRHTRGHAKLPKIVTCLHWCEATLSPSRLMPADFRSHPFVLGAVWVPCCMVLPAC